MLLRFRLLPLLWAAVIVASPLSAQNDKQVIGDQVITPDDIAADASILYLIRFQNVGQDTVQNIVVRDTLDPRLDPSSFYTISASHPFQVLGDGGSFIRGYFEDIHLPDSASGGPNSIGYILFSVQPQPFVLPGQTILNRACISFDDISLICTNEAIVWVDENAAVTMPTVGENDWHIVPNPNYGQFEVRQQDFSQSVFSQSAAQWWVTDMSGRTVWRGVAENTAAVSTQILLEKPVPGLYLLWVQSEKRLEVERFTVVR